MRRPGVLLAGVLVLAADALVLARVAHNRSGSPAAAIELTERELRLVRPQRESTAPFLQLAWEPAEGRFKFEDGPGWFDKAKLEEAGFDCRLPLTDPQAVARYRVMPAKEAFAVLEYNAAAWADAGPDRATWSRLLAVDAGRDFAVLRGKYPDARRFLIAPCLARLIYQTKWDPNTRREVPGAYLRGSIEQMLVSEISVPPSERSVFESLSQTTYDFFATPDARLRGPRYSALLYYGKDHEPWLGSCRRIASGSGR
jgi:hypothetical protein